MKLIRTSVFETNSSSTHSISIGCTGVYEGVTPDALNRIVLEPYEFGWGQDTFTDPLSRMSYVWIYMRDWANNDLSSFCMKEMFHKVVHEHTGADEVSMREVVYNWGTENGYIDHQSAEDGQLHYLFETEDTLKSFLFDSGSTVTTDNDNH